MTTKDNQPARQNLALHPDDVVISERVRDLVRKILGDDAVSRGWGEVAANVLRHWTAGDVDCRIALPIGVKLYDESVAHVGILWEELGLALVDDWVREDNNLPLHDLVAVEEIRMIG